MQAFCVKCREQHSHKIEILLIDFIDQLSEKLERNNNVTD